MIECDFCIEDDADLVIVLSEGQIFQVHEACAFSCIAENASKENPVHSIDKLDKD